MAAVYSIQVKIKGAAFFGTLEKKIPLVKAKKNVRITLSISLRNPSTKINTTSESSDDFLTRMIDAQLFQVQKQ